MTRVLSAPLNPEPDEQRHFNDDLLNNPEDARRAMRQFPCFFDVLNFPELREVFRRFEKRANESKQFFRSVGVCAVLFGTLALFGTVVDPLWHDSAEINVLRIVFELLGLLAAIIAVGSVWLGPWRKRWLEGRFVTERLRQWHFQLLVLRGKEIEAFLDQQITPREFRDLRSRWFEAFLNPVLDKLDSQMESFTRDPDFAGDWLHPISPYVIGGDVGNEIMEAYVALRLNHQYDYATYKLSETTDHPLWQVFLWPITRQQAAIQSLVSFFFVSAILCSMSIIINRSFNLEPKANLNLGIAALTAAILGACFRTIQEGLGLRREIERFRDYRAKVRRIHSAFVQTQDPLERLELMKEMETLAVDELRGFLRTHQEMTFIL